MCSDRHRYAHGARIKRVADRLDGGTFCATYADGVADIDLHALVNFHRRHGDAATMTVVRPLSQFGIAQIDDAGRSPDSRRSRGSTTG